MTEYKHPLIDTRILSVMIAEDKLALRFLIADELAEGGASEVIARCDADCCSYTWIENVELPALGFPAFVQEIEELPLVSHEDISADELLQVYGLKIKTDKGDIVIDYRNSSNGYYGGSLNFGEESHYGGVFGQANSKEVWQPIKDASI